ncbi:MAG: SAM-dependent chlorinase/fluorinase [Gemmatimonadales bacterium]
MSAIITLLTDFGTEGGYVAELKGRLLRLAADVTIVDVAHDGRADEVLGAGRGADVQLTG